MAKRIFAALLTAALLTAGMAACSGQQQTVEEETVQLPADEEQQEARITSNGGTAQAQAEKKPVLQPLDEVKGEQAQDEMDKSFDEILRIFNKDKF